MSDTVAQYDFLSWVRRGAASALGNADPQSGTLPYRGQLAVKLRLSHSQGGGAATGDDVSASAELYGPGDVLGLDPRHVIRTDPAPGTLNYEPNYFTAIEFDQVDLPWLFTPAAPRPESSGGTPSGVRPWLALIALADGEYDVPAGGGQPLPSIHLDSAAPLQDLDDSWAWAHTQVAGGLGAQGAAGLAQVAHDEPARVLSRLICPRRLKPDTAYTAFLVPAFEAGRLAGLGQTVPTSDTGPAWTSSSSDLELPVYYSFAFRTSDAGDFESLVRRLQARAMPPEVGIRPMRVTDVGWAVPDAGGPLGLSGALRSPATTDTDWQNPGRDSFRSSLVSLVNEASDARADDPSDPDPVVVPPIYGRWHAARTSVHAGQAGWLNDLNTDPRPRATAGFGTQVVVAEEPQLMHSAWLQVQGILEANARLRQAQLARSAMAGVHSKHLAGASEADALILTGALHSKLTASPQTVRAAVAASRLPALALSAAFRRVTRPLGPLQRRMGSARVSPAELLRRLNSGELAPAPPYGLPAGLIPLEQALPGSCPGWLPAWLRRWLLLVAIALLVAAAVVLVVAAAAGASGAGWAVAAAVALVLIVLALLALLLWRRCRSGGNGVTFASLSDPTAVADAPAQPGFHLSGSPAPTGVPPGSDSPEGAAFRHAAEQLAAALEPTQFEPAEADPLDIAAVRGSLLDGLNPESTVPLRAGSMVSVDAVLGWAPEDDPIEPIMAAPEFPQPMYAALRDLSQELLLPGLDRIPPDTVSLLEENHAFIEAYMVGLNHEMGRQLLWNDYPTDQRGSYFQQFWDVSGYVPNPGDPTDPTALKDFLRDIPKVHTWGHHAGLGQHATRAAAGSGTGTLVLLVRGELLRRYPNCHVYACPATIDANGQEQLGAEERHPLYRGTLTPDVTFFGFPLGEAEARGTEGDPNDPGWFFVFQQQPSEPRFGLEPAPAGVDPGSFPSSPPTVSEWNDLAWTNFATDQASLDALGFAPAAVQPQPVAIQEDPSQNPGDGSNAWGRDSAQTAFIALRRPVRVGVHARSMLP